MKKLPWKSALKGMERDWKLIQEPTQEQIKKYIELEKPQKNWFLTSNALYPVLRTMLIEMDKHNTVLRNELNTVYAELKHTFKKIKHVNRRTK